MTLTLLRSTILILTLVAIAGCSSLPDFPRIRILSGDADLFARGLDEYRETGELATLRRVSQEYPDSAWRPRAETVIDLAETTVEMAEANLEMVAVNKELAKEKRQQGEYRQRLEALNQELTDCQQEKSVLVQDNQSLELTLERLKKVLIDTELPTN